MCTSTDKKIVINPNLDFYLPSLREAVGNARFLAGYAPPQNPNHTTISARRLSC